MTTTTFAIAAGADDAYISRAGSTFSGWPPTGGTPTVDSTDTELRLSIWDVFSSQYFLGVLLFKWDTSSLPDDATVTGANLLLTTSATGKSDPNGAVFQGDWFNWGASADSPDWTASTPNDARTSYALTNISGTSGTLNTIPLTGFSGISLTGTTFLRLTGMGGSSAPSARHYVAFASFDHATLQEPRLEVTYTTPSTGPSVGMVGG